MRRPILAPVVALVATVAVALLLGLLPSGQVAGAPVTVTGTRALSCPAGEPATLATTVLAGSADGISARALGEGTTGTAQFFLKTPVQKPTVLSGGATVAGLSQSDVASGVNKGLWLAPCRQPGAELWFSGVLSSNAERSAVDLVNIDPTQAIVDVMILGRDGRVGAAGARGLTVPGNSSRTVFLEPLLTSADPVGLQVRTSQGRVAATVRMSGSAGGDWAVPAAPPATTQVIPVVPGGDGARTLIVTNPGSRRVSVKVEALDTTSAFGPAGADSFDVNAESTLAVPLEAALKGTTVALRVTATQPVVTGVRVITGGDLALVGAGGPLGSPAWVPAVPGAQLVVSNAGTSAATVTVTTRSAEGTRLDSSSSQVDAGRSLSLPVTGDRTATFEVTADSTEVRGALVATSSGGRPGVAVVVLGGGGTGAVTFDPTVEVTLNR